MTEKRRNHTMLITVSAPAWLSAKDCRREVRSLIKDAAPWGTLRPAGPGVGWETIDHGDIKPKKICPARSI